MHKIYHIIVNGVQEGPFSLEELQYKSIQKDTLVWMQGLASWTPAGNIPQLQSVIRPTPPPPPHQQAVPPSNNRYINPEPQYAPHAYQQTSDVYFGYRLASRRERFFAMLFETLLCCTLSTPFYFLEAILNPPKTNQTFAEMLQEAFMESYNWSDIIVESLIYAITGAIFYSFWSGNLGHAIMGLKVISADNGRDQNAGNGFVREFVKAISGCFIIPSIWLLWDDKAQNLYDKVLNTYVVKKR